MIIIDTLQSGMLSMLLLFWIPSVSYIIYKYLQIRQSEIVTGKVVNIEPVYRGAKYTFEIQYNNGTETKTISPNTAFQQYRMNDEIQLYRYEKDGIIYYSVKGSNYAIPIVLMSVSLFFFITSFSA